MACPLLCWNSARTRNGRHPRGASASTVAAGTSQRCDNSQFPARRSAGRSVPRGPGQAPLAATGRTVLPSDSRSVSELGRPVAPIPARPARKRGYRPVSQKDRNTGRTTPTPLVVAGIDVGKAHLLDTGLDCRYANTTSGRRALCNRLRKHRVTRAVFEPTGRYHRQLHQCLAAAGLQTVLVNPLRSRRFAAALGQLANNDRVDATMLAR